MAGISMMLKEIAGNVYNHCGRINSPRYSNNSRALGSRKFCQRGSNFDIFCFELDEGREDPNTTISGPPSARQ